MISFKSANARFVRRPIWKRAVASWQQLAVQVGKARCRPSVPDCTVA